MIRKYKKIEGKDLIYKSYDKLLDAWNVDKEEVDIPTQFGLTHAIIAGDPNHTPLLLFHGVGDNSAIMWIYNIQELVKHFYVVAVDTIGGPGKSNPNENYFKSFNQITWIDDILNHLKIDKTLVAGVSNGAFLAQYYTIARPDRVIKSICMSGGVSHIKAKNPMIKMMMVFLPEALFPNDKNIKKLLMKMCGTNYSVFLDNEAVFSHWGLLLKYFNNMHMSMHKIVKFTDEQIEILREKSLFIIGDKDRLVYEKDTVDTLNNLKVTYKIIEGAGHGINHEMSEDINKLIVEFFC